jgi:membrane protease YdiL (CAAX protease family)
MKQSNKFPVRFFIITFCWSWILWLPLALAGSGVIYLENDLVRTLLLPFIILGAFGPAVGAVLSIKTINGKGEVTKFLKTFFDVGFGFKTWLIPTILLLISTMIAWFVPELFGMNRLSMLLPSVFVFPVYWLLMVFGGGGQEEIGWRGYILAHLEKRFGVIPGSVILSVVWALWHLPLWFIPGTSQSFMNFGGFMMLNFGYSFLFSWGLKKAGNRPLAGLVMHGTANSFIPLFPTLSMQLGDTQPRFWIWVSITFLIGLIFAIFLKKDENQQSRTMGR